MQQHSNATLNDNWRTINIDALDPESSSNFDSSTLHPAFAPVSADEVRSIGQQVRQLLRGGDPEGALRGALESAPYGGDASVKVGEFLDSLCAGLDLWWNGLRWKYVRIGTRDNPYKNAERLLFTWHRFPCFAQANIF